MGAYVSGLRRYPVKGLGGESLDSVELCPTGIPWDRAVALPNGRHELRPDEWAPFEAFLVLKNRGDLGHLSARVTPLGAGLMDALSIEVMRDGTSIASTAIRDGRVQVAAHDTVNAWIGVDGAKQQVFSPGAALWDAEEAPVSLINLATVRAIGSAMGVDLDPLRFRGNIYLDGMEPWEELAWAGRRLSIGGALVEVFSTIERCRATSARPGSDGWDLNVPGGLAAHYGHIHNGIYARVIGRGRIQAGDEVAPVDEFDGRRLLLGDIEEDSRAPRFADVVAIESTAPDTYSVTFQDSYGVLSAAHAGQHLRIHRLNTADWRNYTISGATFAGSRITVKRNVDGRFSPWIADLSTGDRVVVSGPFGRAHIDSAATGPVVVLTAGIGITPALSIARDDDQDGYWHRGRPTAEFILGLIDDPDDVTVFICGPKPFLTEMSGICRQRGVASGSIHIDPFYSPLSPDLEPREPPSAGPFQVQWPDRTISSWTRDDGTLLDLAEAAGKSPPAGCRSGACGTCEASVSGETYSLLDTFAEAEEGRALLCSSVPLGDLAINWF